MIFTKKFWKATAERSIASVAGGALSVIGADAFGVVDADWVGIASIALGAGVVSVLKALAAGVSDGNPSIGSQETVGDTRTVQLHLDTDAVVEKLKAEYEGRHEAE